MVRSSSRPSAVLILVLTQVACAASPVPDPGDSPANGTGGVPNVAGSSASGSGGLNATSGSSSRAGSSGGAGRGGASNSAGHTAGGVGGLPFGGRSASGGSAGRASAGGAGSPAGGTGAHLPLPYTEDFETPAVMPEWYLSIGENGEQRGAWATVRDTLGNALTESTKDDESWAVGGDYSWTDQRLEVKVKIGLATPEDVAEAAFRIAVRYNLGRWYYAEFRGDGAVRIGKQASSGGGDLGTEGRGPAFPPQTWVTIAFEARGRNLVAYIGSAKVAEAADDTIPSGGIGLGGSDDVAMLYDDLRVTSD